MAFQESSQEVRRDWIVLFAVPIILFLGVNFFFHVYRYILNSDSAFNLILAKAVLDEDQFFPKDVWFSHDIYLLRPHWLIAGFRLLGFRGLWLYGVAGATLITACFYAVFLALQHFGRLPVYRALAAAVFVFIPLGQEETEYVLGQQSHLLQVTLALVGLLASGVLSRRPSRAAQWVVVVAAFLLCWDSPPRGALFTAGALMILAPATLASLTARYATVALLAGAVAGVAADLWVKSQISIVGVSAYLFIPSTQVAISRLGTQVAQYLALFAGTDDLAGASLSAPALAVLASKLALGLTIIGLSAYLLVRFVRNVASGGIPPIFVQLASAALVISIATCLAVSFSDLALDIRHYLPALIAMKAATFLVFDAALPRLRAVLIPALLGTTVTASALAPAVMTAQPPFGGDRLDVVAVRDDILSIIKERHWAKPVTLYGTYWNSSNFEVLLDGYVEAAPVSVEGHDIRIYEWMSRPSRYCRRAPSLLLARTNQPTLAAIAVSQGAQLLKTTRFERIYLVAPTVVADCALRKDLRPPTGDSSE